MDEKKLEQKLQVILNDDNFKINIGEEYSCISSALENLIDNIAKLNDAIENSEHVKEYYSDIFNSRNKYINFIIKCEDLKYLLESRRKEIKLQFKDFIEEIYKNKDLQIIIMKDLPIFSNVLTAVKLDNENLVGISEVISYLDGWLDVISVDDLENYFVELLEDVIQDFYDIYFEKQYKKQNKKE